MENIPQINPSTLTLITTHRCTSACPNCCFNCSPAPHNKKTMTYAEMRQYISSAKTTFPSIQIVIFTGGECTLLEKDLLRAITYATSLGLQTRIVTNGHWANDIEKAEQLIENFITAGLTEINFSTGDEHTLFTSFETVVTAVSLCLQTNQFSSVLVNIEGHFDSDLTEKQMFSNPKIANLTQQQKEHLSCITSSWVCFRKFTENKNIESKQAAFYDNKRGCQVILDGIGINPNGQFLSCCGLSSEYSPFLKLGKITRNNIRQLHNSRFQDILKLWLYTDGPYQILTKIGCAPTDKTKHNCEYCLELLTKKENLLKLMSIDKSQVRQILLDYSLKHQQHERQNN